jgi:hypothetical protein
MNRFMKAGPAAAREFLEAKYAKGGKVKQLGAALDDMLSVEKIREDAMGRPQTSKEPGMYTMNERGQIVPLPGVELRERVTKVSPLQQMSEEDIAAAAKMSGMPFLKSTGKANKKVIDVFLQDALEEWQTSGRSKEKFIDKFMDYGVDFDELDDLIFQAEKIPTNMRGKVAEGSWPAYENLRMRYYHEIEDAISRKIK